MSSTQQQFYKVLENYKLTNKILNSEQPKVYQAIHLRTQIRVCISVVSKKPLKEKPNTSENTLKLFTVLNHHNLVKLFEILQDKNNYYLILENFKGRYLSGFLKFNKDSLNEETNKNLLVQLICLLSYFQKKKVNLNVVNESSIFVDQNFNLKVNIFSPENLQCTLGELVEKAQVQQNQNQENSRRSKQFFLKFVIGIFLRQVPSSVTTNEENFNKMLNKFSASKNAIIFFQKILQTAQQQTKGSLDLEEIKEYQWIGNEYERYVKYLKQLETVQGDILNTIIVNKKESNQLRTKLELCEDDQETFVYKMYFNKIQKSKCLKLNLVNNQEKVDWYIKKKISQIKKCLNPNEIMESEILEMENTSSKNSKENSLENESENDLDSCFFLNLENFNSETKTKTAKNLNNLFLPQSRISSDSFSDNNIFQSFGNSPKTKSKKLKKHNLSQINKVQNKNNKKKKEDEYKMNKNKKNINTELNIFQEERKQQQYELEKMLGELSVVRKSKSQTFLHLESNPNKVLKNQINNSSILNNNQKTKIKLKNDQRNGFPLKDQMNKKKIEKDPVKKTKKRNLVELQLNRTKPRISTTNSLTEQFSPSQLTRINKKWRNNPNPKHSKYELFFTIKEKSKSNPNINAKQFLYTNSPSLKNLHQMRKHSRNTHAFSRSFDFTSTRQKNNNKIYPNKKNTNTFEKFPNNLAIIKLFNLKAFKVKKNKLLNLLKEIFLIIGICMKKTKKDTYLCSTNFQNKSIKFEIKVQKNKETKLGKVTFKRLNCNYCIFHNLWAEIYDIYTHHL
ncbi:cbl-interacting serine/threonine-protein kinase [Anaeramoeba flamelloides]|uniref:Cbl-interacting serine/threonine-protein kinase n=1 Tax=Anaeramoeba flamelloides TaxID=1746091 RepID=A0AAV7YH91_9EUKA|nr:cbl-interacting serine/threonine-protein kinase [Anaeramoeba flamelloides]